MNRWFHSVVVLLFLASMLIGCDAAGDGADVSTGVNHIELTLSRGDVETLGFHQDPVELSFVLYLALDAQNRVDGVHFQQPVLLPNVVELAVPPSSEEAELVFRELQVLPDEGWVPGLNLKPNGVYGIKTVRETHAKLLVENLQILEASESILLRLRWDLQEDGSKLFKTH